MSVQLGPCHTDEIGAATGGRRRPGRQGGRHVVGSMMVDGVYVALESTQREVILAAARAMQRIE
jgi:hypothetical protein